MRSSCVCPRALQTFWTLLRFADKALAWGPSRVQMDRRLARQTYALPILSWVESIRNRRPKGDPPCRGHTQSSTIKETANLLPRLRSSSIPSAIFALTKVGIRNAKVFPDPVFAMPMKSSSFIKAGQTYDLEKIFRGSSRNKTHPE